jgi:hypothetical protein
VSLSRGKSIIGGKRSSFNLKNNEDALKNLRLVPTDYEDDEVFIVYY